MPMKISALVMAGLLYCGSTTWDTMRGESITTGLLEMTLSVNIAETDGVRVRARLNVEIGSNAPFSLDMTVGDGGGVAICRFLEESVWWKVL